MIAFAISGGLSAFGGVLLAGYASKAAQSMGDPYLLPSIAAVVLGGTSILGGTRHLSRHHRRRHPDHAAAVDPVGDADAGGGTADHLRRRHRRHAAALWPQPREPVVASQPMEHRVVRACVVMGVAGCGKSAVGSALAQTLGWTFVEGDRLQPAANVERMASGLPLTDDHRWGWLDAVGEEIALAGRAGDGSVAACSALKRAYRDRLRRHSDQIAVHPSRDRQGHRGAEGRLAKGPFHAGEPGRQPVRRSAAAGSRRKGCCPRCEAPGRTTGGQCRGYPSGPLLRQMPLCH